MKKLTLILMAMMVAVSLTLTACNNNTQPSQADAPSEVDNVEEEEGEEEESPAADDTDADQEEDSNDEGEAAGDADDADDITAQLDELKAVLEASSQGMYSVDLKVDGETYIISLQFNDELEDGMAEALEAGMEAMGPTFDSYVQMLKDAGMSSAAFQISYLDVNGDVITSAEFK